MGVIVGSIGPTPVDRSIARLEIFSELDNRDDWRIVLHFQDAPYDGATRLDEPRFGTQLIEVRYGEIKDWPLPGGGKVSDLFGPVRALGYALRQRQIDVLAAKQQ